MDNSLLHPKQIEAYEKLRPQLQSGNGGIVWHKMGEGKSRTALAILDGLKFIKPGITLIVCRRKAFYSWREEIRKAEVDVMVGEYPPPSGQEALWSKRRKTIWLVSHAMLHRILDELNFPIQFVILDELYLYSNHKSKRSIAAAKCCKLVHGRVLGLSGTIIPAKDNLAIWGQSLVCGLSHHLAKGTTDFYSRFKKSFLVDFGRGRCAQWSDLPDAKERILNLLAPYTHLHFPKSSRLIAESSHDLPLTIQQSRIIRQLKEEYYVAFEEQGFEIELRSALELILKVSQIANGWVKNKDGIVANIPSNKLDCLCASLEEAHAINHKVLVWCHFRHDIDRIQECLEFKTLKMSGSHEFDREAYSTGKFPIVLATVGSGSSVNDFQHVADARYYSHSFKHLDFVQSKARTDRLSSHHRTCQYTHYFAQGTFDRHIYNTLNKTGNVEHEFIQKGILKQWLQK